MTTGASATGKARCDYGYLIETRGLKQGDLAEVVPQSNLSAILAGKLAKFFNISPAVFVPT